MVSDVSMEYFGVDWRKSRNYKVNISGNPESIGGCVSSADSQLAQKQWWRKVVKSGGSID